MEYKAWGAGYSKKGITPTTAMREIEIKLKAPNLDLIVEKLVKLGCEISEPKTQEDRNFVHKDDTKWFETAKKDYVYPRLRIQGGKPLTFTVKKPLKNEMDCIEHELHVDSAEELSAIMTLFGYVPGVTVKKTRRTTAYKDYTITLDEVEKLGSFVEIERVVSDGDALKIQNQMFHFAEQTLGLKRDDFIMKGYDILMHHLENKTA
jgi:adenylate cyclase, class 2